jgi:hypothetical protein
MVVESTLTALRRRIEISTPGMEHQKTKEVLNSMTAWAMLAIIDVKE